jgi:hypothetical protein
VKDMTAGYSATPLVRKLGIKDGSTLAVIADPGHFLHLLEPLPPDVHIRTSARGKADTVVFFTKRRADLARRIGTLSRMIFPAAGLWVCWPKRASRVPTDMTEDVVRDVILPLGLVDIKVAAVDETWSGLRIVHRRENR